MSGGQEEPRPMTVQDIESNLNEKEIGVTKIRQSIGFCLESSSTRGKNWGPSVCKGSFALLVNCLQPHTTCSPYLQCPQEVNLELDL
jgi:hypothetical protein